LPASLSTRWNDGVLRRELGCEGAVVAEDLSMAGAAGFGAVVRRARRARAAGCDVLPVGNDRPSALELLDGLRATVNPVSRLRLARLHGREPTGLPLDTEPRWHAAVASARECVERPALRLEGDLPA
jgi:beta-N-acetylhexosaminidase